MIAQRVVQEALSRELTQLKVGFTFPRGVGDAFLLAP